MTKRVYQTPSVISSSGAAEYLTVDEAADLLRINRKTLYDAIKLDQVPGVVRIGRSIRIRREVLLAWGAGTSAPAAGAGR